MGFRINFNGANKEDTLKSIKEQSEQLVKSKDMDAAGQSRLVKFVESLEGNVITGTVQDNNNGTTVYNVTVRTAPEPAEAKAVKMTPSSTTANRPAAGMPGAAAAGRPDAAPGAQK